MRNSILVIISIALFAWSCNKNDHGDINISDKITIDSLTATFNTVKAWDTTSIYCYATGDSLIYSWDCDHGDFNGSGFQIKYAAGECCVGVNTITCTVSNNTGKVSKEIKIKVTSYFNP